MPKTEETASTEAADPETGPALELLIGSVAASDTEDDRVEAWHQYAEQHADELHVDVLEARRALHHGTPADAVSLADRHVASRAQAAAAQAGGVPQRTYV